ncbi:MAG: hypothetical protein ACF8AM_01465 [Rhodopirellula sp. JB055]|uniref:hypothetical protein n=1 Tax=Rhodopirellula sp. JB055 TaxID=3342846 RepID=UPI00370BABF8
MIQRCTNCLSSALVLAVVLTLPSPADEPARQTQANSIGMQFVAIEPGEYRRVFDKSNQRDRKFALAHAFSNPQEFRFDSPSHLVVLKKPFQLKTKEVNFSQLSD